MSPALAAWLVPGAISLIVLGAFFLAIRHLRAEYLRRNASMARANPAEAIILEMEQQDVSSGSPPKGRLAGVRVVLEVHPHYGALYRATVYWQGLPLVFASLRQGQKVKVKIDRADSNIVYPDFSGADYHWLLAEYYRIRANRK